MRLASFYDRCAVHYDADYEAAGYHQDIPFYVELARGTGGPVLEMGCGTGRVLVAVARAGVEVVGVELSAAMLERAEEALAAEPEEIRRHASLRRGDLRTVDLGPRFRLVTAPFRVVQHLVDRDDQKAWLANVRRHLAPGGELVFDVFQPDYSMIGGGSFTAVDVERTDPDTGRRVRRVSRSEYSPELQTFEGTFEWLIDEPDGTQRTEPAIRTTVRWFTRCELENLLELAGFELLHVWGDFEHTPFGEGAEDIVIHARRRR